MTEPRRLPLYSTSPYSPEAIVEVLEMLQRLTFDPRRKCAVLAKLASTSADDERFVVGL